CCGILLFRIRSRVCNSGDLGKSITAQRFRDELDVSRLTSSANHQCGLQNDSRQPVLWGRSPFEASHAFVGGYPGHLKLVFSVFSISEDNVSHSQELPTRRQEHFL